MELFNTLNDIRKNWKSYGAWEQEQNDKELRKKSYIKDNPIPKDKLELSQSKTRAVVEAINTIDEKSEDASQEMELATESLAMAVILPLALMSSTITEKFQNSKLIGKIAGKTGQTIAAMLGPSVLMLAPSMAMILGGTALEKQASRIARNKAKKEDLKDYKNFITYTPEQIEKAKTIAEGIPEKKEESKLQKSINAVKNLFKHPKNYKEYLNEKNILDKEDKLPQLTNYDESKVREAKTKQDPLKDIVKKINAGAEEYSESMEQATQTLIGTSFIVSTIPAFIAGKIAGAFQKAGKLPNNAGKFAFGATYVLTPIILSIKALSEKKEASRVGRFKAKEEVLNNAASMIEINENKLEKYKDIKAAKEKESFFKNLTDDFKFIFSYYTKDKKDYNRYKKETNKQNDKLNEALKQVAVSNEQIKDAKILQKRLFNIFEVVDEQSQKYSEDAEAAGKIGMQLAGFIPSILMVAVAGIGLLLNKKGILTAEKTQRFANSCTEKAIRTITNNQERINKFINSHPKITKFLGKVVKEATEIDLSSKKFEHILVEAAQKPTLRNIGIAGMITLAVPAFAALLSPTFVIGSILTNFQKKAQKIGVMKAMQELDNKENINKFIKAEDSNEKSVIVKNEHLSSNNNLFNRLSKLKTT